LPVGPTVTDSDTSVAGLAGVSPAMTLFLIRLVVAGSIEFVIKTPRYTGRREARAKRLPMHSIGPILNAASRTEETTGGFLS
jgi:hypothetical protein